MNDECTTPDGSFGDCVPIKECKTIIDFIEKSAKPLSESVKKKLSSYRCKTDTDDVNVCCPYSPIKIEEEGPPDVSNHRNINLLPQDCGYQPSDFKIVNGQNTLLNEFPWMALLKYNTSKYCKSVTFVKKKKLVTRIRFPITGCDPQFSLYYFSP